MMITLASKSQLRLVSHCSRQIFSSCKRLSSSPSILDDAAIHRRGGESFTESCEYLLLPADMTLHHLKEDPKIAIASIRSYRNMVFGAKIFDENVKKYGLVKTCTPLLQTAMACTEAQGVQAQALSTLNGLCEFARKSIEENDVAITSKLDDQSLDACLAIASGIPHADNKDIFRAGKDGWQLLAKEFIEQGLAEEVDLYRSNGAEVVRIEHLADTSEKYMKTAGGAMCLLFFTHTKDSRFTNF